MIHEQAIVDPGAKLATTIVKTLQFDGVQDCSRLEMQPLTGRMHQLRLQSSLRGHPIVGDQAYGATKQHTACGSGGSGEQRIMLHAFRLRFHDPATGRWTEV